MTIPFKIGVGDLITEFLTHAEILWCFLQTAGAVSILASQTLPDLFHHLGIIIETDLHEISPL